MFGAAWLNLAVAVTFGLVGSLSLARVAITGRRELGENAWHVVMAAGMVAMALPAADPFPHRAWGLCFTVAAIWCVVTLLRIGPIYGQLGTTIGPSAWRRIAGRITHQLTASLLMLAVVTIGHPAADEGPSVPHRGHVIPAHGTTAPNLLAWLLGAGFLVAAARMVIRLPRIRCADRSAPIGVRETFGLVRAHHLLLCRDGCRDGRHGRGHGMSGPPQVLSPTVGGRSHFHASTTLRVATGVRPWSGRRGPRVGG